MSYYYNVLTFTWERDTVTSNCTVSRFHLQSKNVTLILKLLHLYRIADCGCFLKTPIKLFPMPVF